MSETTPSSSSTTTAAAAATTTTAASATNGTATPRQNGSTTNGTTSSSSSSTTKTTTMMMTDTNVTRMSVEEVPEMVRQLTEALEKCSTTSVMSSPSSAPEEKGKFLRHRAQCYLRLQDYTSALADAEAAVAENSHDIESFIAAGQASAALGRPKESLHFYKAGLRIDPNSKIIADKLRQLQVRIVQMSEVAAEAEPTYNALDFCTQDPYPGDDTQLLLEREILETKYKVSNALLMDQGSAEREVNPVEAAKCLKLAYEAITTGHYQEAVTQCTRAINVDPNNVFARRFRAQLFFDNSNMIEALKDLWNIPKASRNPDIWSLGGKILHSLWLPVTAEFWLRKATATSGKKNVEAAVLFQKIRVKRLYEPLTRDFPVTVDFTHYGRAVVATDDVKAGEVLLKDLPLVHAQTLASRHIRACTHCAASLISAKDYFVEEYDTIGTQARSVVDRHWPDVSPVWCPRCSREMYCSEQCREAAWESYHRMLCPSVNKAATKLYDLRDKDGWGEDSQGNWVELWGGHYSPFVLAKLWAAILGHVDKMMEEAGNKGGKPTVEQWATAKAPYRRFIAFGTTPATERMPEMLTVFRQVFENTPLQGLHYPITDAEFKGRYYQAACNLQCFSAAINPFHRFLARLQDDLEESLSVLRHLDENKIPEPYFAGMFPVHACLNHSCENNAEVSNGQLNGHFGVQVTAKRDIKKGEEIFITYIDTALPRILRRAWVFKSFNFWCQCRRCQFEGDAPTTCTQCGAKSEPGKKFPTCGKCHKAWYCSTKCQRAAWTEGHKVICLTKHSLVANPQDYEVC